MLAVALAVRAQTFGNPVLHIDEQFYLLVGDRMWSGAVPYVDIWDRKPVGLFLIYASARLLGGEGVVQYQLLATLSAAATAYLAVRIAERFASQTAALLGGAAYLLWLNFDHGDGGQAAVFFNLPMAGAALLTLRVLDGAPPRATGAVAMLLVGVAMQIKYTAVFEGVFFGLALLWASRAARLAETLVHAALWVACALLPTIAAAAAYGVMGHLDAFVFANFVSIGARGAAATGPALERLGTLVLILSPLFAGAFASRLWSVPPPDGIATRFVALWLIWACLAVLAFGTWFKSYGLPIMLPAAVAAARAFDRGPVLRRVVMAMLVLALVLGQTMIALAERGTGGRVATRATLAAMHGHPGCLYVYNGHSILYHLDRSCLPSRFVFPGHLNQANEAPAIGVDTVAEVRRILDTRPGVIATVTPPWPQGNAATRTLVEARLVRDYRLVHTVRTRKRLRQLWRLRTPTMLPPRVQPLKAGGE